MWLGGALKVREGRLGGKNCYWMSKICRRDRPWPLLRISTAGASLRARLSCPVPGGAIACGEDSATDDDPREWDA
jgi:hypothetical protein